MVPNNSDQRWMNCEKMERVEVSMEEVAGLVFKVEGECDLRWLVAESLPRAFSGA